MNGLGEGATETHLLSGGHRDALAEPALPTASAEADPRGGLHNNDRRSHHPYQETVRAPEREQV